MLHVKFVATGCSCALHANDVAKNVSLRKRKSEKKSLLQIAPKFVWQMDSAPNSLGSLALLRSPDPLAQLRRGDGEGERRDKVGGVRVGKGDCPHNDYQKLVPMRSRLFLGYSVVYGLCWWQKHGNDDAVDSTARCAARHPPSPSSTSSTGSGAAGGRTVSRKTTSVVPAAPANAIGTANNLKVGWIHEHYC